MGALLGCAGKRRPIVVIHSLTCPFARTCPLQRSGVIIIVSWCSKLPASHLPRHSLPIPSRERSSRFTSDDIDVERERRRSRTALVEV